MIPPSYDLRPAKRADVLPLFLEHHGYKSLSNSTTYLFAVWENDRVVQAFAWQPPPPGAAKSVCPEAPYGVLALSRMVAVPEEDRRTRLRNPLRKQMRSLIDRTRWPVLVTYSDEGQGHTGYIYQITGWEKTVRSKRPTKVGPNGERLSSYSNGKHGSRDLSNGQSTWIQRWEHWRCERGEAHLHIGMHEWQRTPVLGKKWASGNPAFTYVRFLDEDAA